MTETPWESPDGSASDVPAAGWRSDPTGRHKLRYWNGTSWTDDVSDGGGVASTDPLTTAQPVKWYRRRFGPLPVWGWAFGAFVLLGAIGNLTDESEPDAPTADADRATNQEAENSTGDKSDAGTSDADEKADDQSAPDEAASDRTRETTSEEPSDEDRDAPETADAPESAMSNAQEADNDTASDVDYAGPSRGDVVSPWEYLSFLTVAEEGPRDGYSRDDWRHWSTKSWSGCTSREEVLVRTVIGEPAFATNDNCKVTNGWWYSDYDNTWTSNSSDFDIDHIVALSEAHDSGAADWSKAEKERFANDLSNLVAVSASSNRSKSDRDVSEWRPRKAVWCSFAYAVVEVKANYNLTVDPDEYDALEEMIDTCSSAMSSNSNWWTLRTGMYFEYSDQSPTPPTTTVPSTSAPATTTPPTTTTPPATTAPATTTPPATAVPTTTAAPETTAAPSPPANPGDSKNCDSFSTYAEAKAWFDTYFPYYGDVARLDRDNDGEPCESLPGAPG